MHFQPHPGGVYNKVYKAHGMDGIGLVTSLIKQTNVILCNLHCTNYPRPDHWECDTAFHLLESSMYGTLLCPIFEM